MSKQLSITIPSDLFNRLQAVKDRFNVSGVSQRAIEQAVTLEELKLKGSDDMDSVIERLRAERDEYDKTYEEDGREEGIKAGKELAYEDLVAVNKLAEYLEVMHQSSHGLTQEQLISGIYACEVWGNFLEDDVTELEKDDSAFNRTMFLTGWIEGVSGFYDEVQSKL